MMATDFPGLITEQQNFLRALLPVLQSVLRENEELVAAVEAELANLR